MKTITVEVSVHATLEKAWEVWTTPVHIMKWNQASIDWYCPAAINDLRVGGTFVYTMAAKGKNVRFDFSGTYTDVEPLKQISYTLGGKRNVMVLFEKVHDQTIKVSETFEMESSNSEEDQKKGWQSILESFKSYCESTTSS